MSQEEERENVNAEGISDAIQDIRDDFNNIIYDIYRNHVINPKKGEKWTSQQRKWMMTRAVNLFGACKYEEETLTEWVQSPDRLNWTSFVKDWKYFKLLDKSRELELKLDNNDDIPSPDNSPDPRPSRRQRYRYDPDQSHNHNRKNSKST